MKPIKTYIKPECLSAIARLQAMESECHRLLPQYLHQHYRISQNTQAQPMILVNHASWMLQLRTFEPQLQALAMKQFKHALIWKVRPILTPHYASST